MHRGIIRCWSNSNIYHSVPKLHINMHFIPQVGMGALTVRLTGEHPLHVGTYGRHLLIDGCFGYWIKHPATFRNKDLLHFYYFSHLSEDDKPHSWWGFIWKGDFLLRKTDHWSGKVTIDYHMWIITSPLLSWESLETSKKRSGYSRRFGNWVWWWSTTRR